MSGSAALEEPGQRFALLAKDGKVTHVGVEPPGGFEVSKAEALLAAL